MDLSDQQLVSRLAEHDAAAFEALYGRHRAALRQLLERLVHDPHTAEDLLQEVFVRLWTLDRSRWPVDAFRPWLFRVATNLALNHLRAVGRRVDQPGAVTPQAVEPAGPGADEALQRAADQTLCRQLVDDLAAGQRVVVQLVYQDELSVRDVAERLGIPEGTVKSRLHHARRHLARRWRELDPDAEEPR